MTDAPNPPPVTTTDDKFLTRREFLTLLGGLGVSLAVATALSEIEPLEQLIAREVVIDLPDVQGDHGHGHVSNHKHRWGMVIDLSKCISNWIICINTCRSI